jgi:hypothetical protein
MKGNLDFGFYLPTSRAWELLAGSALSIAVPVKRRMRVLEGWITRIEEILRVIVYAPGARAEGSLLKNLLATAGIVIVGVVSVKFNSKLPYPGYYAAAPVLAAVLLITAAGSWPNRVFLASRPLVFVGVISYPLYLWHYPIISYGHLLKPRGVPPLAMAAFVLGSLVLAWLTYRFVEKPVRFGAARQYAALPLLAMMGITCAAGVFIFRGDGLPGRMPKSLRSFMLTGDETSAYWRRGTCLLLPDQGPGAFGAECAGNGRRPLFLLWGDSYAAAQYPGLLHFSEQGDFDVAEFTSSACPPALGFVHPERPFCTPINDFVLRRIQKLRPDVVILHSTWSYNPAALDTGLRATLKELRAIPIKKVILLGPVPQWSGDGLSANVIVYYYENGLSLIPAKTTYRLANLDADERMRKMAESLGVEYLSPWKVLCDSEGCLARVGPNGENLTAFDSGHMTVAGSTYLVGQLLPDLMRGVK